MSTNLHPDLQKKVPSLTFSRWNIKLFRFAMKYLSPKHEPRDSIETSIVVLDGIELRVHKPKAKDFTSALLWIHGGGLIIGDPNQDDGRCAEFAERLQITVIAVKYRLAPEHPSPAAIDDCFAAWSAIQEHHEELGINPQSVVIGGASAGGGLAASLALRVRDEGAQHPRGQLLVYPMLDDRTTQDIQINPKGHLVWNNQSNATGWGAYLGDALGQDTIPPYAAAARHDNLDNLPQTWIGVGTLDLFHDEDLAYAERLITNDISTTVHIVEGGYHGFDALDEQAQVSKDFVSAMVDFLHHCFHETIPTQD